MPIDMRVLANNFTHVEVTFKDVSRKKARDGVVSFQRPAFYHFRTRANETAEYKPNLPIWCVPIEDGRSRVIFADLRIPGVPNWLGHAGSMRFLNSDTWLHDAERAARIGSGGTNKIRGPVSVGAARVGRESADKLNYIYSSKSDLGPSTFRSWWLKHGFADAPPNTFGPASASTLPSRAMSRAEQIDPWVHHAKNCAKCRGALRNMRLLQKVSTAGAAIGAILLRRKPPIAIAAVLLGMWAHNFLRKFATVIEGNVNRAEIDDRSVAAIK